MANMVSLILGKIQTYSEFDARTIKLRNRETKVKHPSESFPR